VECGFFFWRRQLRNFENVTLVARRKEYFQGVWAIFWLLNSLQIEQFEYTRIHSAQDRYCARGLGGGATKQRGNEKE